MIKLSDLPRNALVYYDKNLYRVISQDKLCHVTFVVRIGQYVTSFVGEKRHQKMLYIPPESHESSIKLPNTYRLRINEIGIYTVYRTVRRKCQCGIAVVEFFLNDGKPENTAVTCPHCDVSQKWGDWIDMGE